MRILLMTSPAPSKKEYGFYLGEKRFPLGLGYITAMLKSKGYNSVAIRDVYAKPKSISFKNFDVIGIYANTICFKRGTLPLLEAIKGSLFKGKIVIGGPHTSVLLDSIPDYVDHVVVGEGEYAFLSIIENSNTDRIIKSERILDLDALPRVAYEMYETSLYNLKFEEYSKCNRVFTYSSSRGCPFSCTFCSSKNIYNRKWTAHSPERVLDDIQYLVKTFKVDGIYFREDNFTVNKNRVRKICQGLINRRIKIKWKCETRVDTSYEDLALMKKAGCVALYVGFESGSPKLLEKFNKQISVEQSRKFIGDCNKLGIYIYGSFVYYSPYETLEDRQLTEKFIKSVKLDRVGKNKYLALPGSEMYDDIIENPEIAEKYKTIIIK